MLKIQRQIDKDLGYLSLEGVLDISTVDLFKSAVDELDLVPSLCVDLEKIRFVDSTGIGAVVYVIRNQIENGKEIRITNIPPNIFEVFEIVGLPEIFGKEIFATFET